MSNDADVGRATPRTWRRGWWLAAATVVAVVLALVAAVTVRALRQDTVPTGPPPPPVGCDAAVAPGHDVPSGATAIMLCDSRTEPMLHVAAPPDALTTDVAAVVEAYHRLPTMPSQPVCSADRGPSFELVLTYAGRAPVRVRGELYGCWGVGDRTGSRVVLDTFVERLRAQRAGREPWTGAAEPASCRARFPVASYIIPTPAELAGQSAVLCFLPATDTATTRTATIKPATWAVLQADLVTNSGPGEPTGEPRCREGRRSSPPVVLVATNSYGDRITIDIHCNGDGWWRTHVRGSEPWMRWQPSPAARDLLVQLAG